MINSEEESVKTNMFKVFKFDIRTYTMIIALLAIWIIFSVSTHGSFLTPRNLSNLFRQMAITGLLSIGMIFVIIAGHIDLSVGSMMGLLGGIAAILNVWYNVNGIVSILITLVAGLLLGLWNGYWVAYRNVPSFIATLAGMLIFRGVLIGISKGMTIAPLSDDFQFIGQAYFTPTVGYIMGAIIIVAMLFNMIHNRKTKMKHNFDVSLIKVDVSKFIGSSILVFAVVLILNMYQGIPIPVFILVVIAMIFNYVSNKMVFGRRVYAVGGNKEAAILSGIDAKKIILIIFAISGLMAATAGVLLTSRLNAASVAAGQNAETDAIASCVIGGASLAGGSGTVGGTMIGTLVMASIDNGMSMLNAAPFWQYVVKGIILLMAVWLDMESKNKE